MEDIRKEGNKEMENRREEVDKHFTGDQAPSRGCSDKEEG